MQLSPTTASWGGRLATALALALGVASPAAAHAEEGRTDVRVRSEVAGYTDSVAVGVLTPSVRGKVESPTAGWSVDGSYLVDVVTAASPDVVSTASRRWSEVRQAGAIGGRYKPGDVGFAANGSLSSSPDYLSGVGNVQALVDLDEKNLLLAGSYSYGHDVIGRTGTSFSSFSRLLDYHGGGLTLTRPLSRQAVLSLVADVLVERGDQSKPYRYIPLFSPQVAPTITRGASPDVVSAARLPAKPIEQLPLGRERYAGTARLAYRFDASTLRLEERIYGDSWGIFGSTTDARWMFDVGARWIVWPHVRFHAQSAVEFWKRAYASTGPTDIPVYRTGDRELGGLVSFGSGLGARWSIGPAGERDRWVITATGDGTYTSFADALFVRERFAILAVVGVEALF
jgi:hypothetical protein